MTPSRKRALALADFLDGHPLPEDLRDFAPAVSELRRLVEELAPDPERVALLARNLPPLRPPPHPKARFGGPGSAIASGAAAFTPAAERAKSRSSPGQAGPKEKT